MEEEVAKNGHTPGEVISTRSPSKLSFNKAVIDLGYCVNEKGEIRAINTQDPFDWKRHTWKEKEQLVAQISNYVIQQCIVQYDMIPFTVDHLQFNKSNHALPPLEIYMSKSLLNRNIHKKKILLIIQGSGSVRCGLWSEGDCLNSSLIEGSMLPYVDTAINRGYHVIIANPHVNAVEEYLKTNFPGEDIKYVKVKRQTFEEHILAVWDTLIMPLPSSTKVYIVAHSFGGNAVLNLLKERSYLFITRVGAVAFTDTVHHIEDYFPNSDTDKVKFLDSVGIHFAASSQELNTPLKTGRTIGCATLSAGTPQHELTPHKAIDEIFNHFETSSKQSTPTQESQGNPQSMYWFLMAFMLANIFISACK